MVAMLLALCLSQQEDPAVTEALATFESTYSKTKEAGARSQAITGLSKTHHERVVNRLGNLLTRDDKATRITAAQSLATFNDTPELKKSAAHALASALNAGSNAKEVEVQVAIFAAIGHLGDESSVTVLKGHFDDKDIQLAQAAISASGALKCKVMVEPLIDELRDCEKKAKVPDPPSGGKPRRVVSSKGGGGSSGEDPEAQKRERASQMIPTIQGALSTLTGQSLNLSADWEKWWSKNRATFSP